MTDGNALQAAEQAGQSHLPRAQKRHGGVWGAVSYAGGCSLVAIASATALLWVTGPQTITVSAAPSLSVVATDWKAVVPGHARTADVALASDVTRRAALPAVAGDEGFWLSRHDIAGSTAGSVSLGDRITIASKSRSASTQEHVFEVVELKSVVETSGGVAAASHVAADGHKPSLTLVVCREVIAGSAGEARIIRFLMEGTAAPSHPIGSDAQPQRSPSAL